MRLSDFDYDLPDELIAQRPVAHRGESRLLVVSRT
ncbi:MAG TPA: S-adenosylmethionine:tRNA ribosyltransferase-isomerase, partial [Gemmatimonadales bacterium]|nr:S-adenosylmethionine:tRNA ribosyltransferase-isomerase [Gemmatimonadales bacterium]